MTPERHWTHRLSPEERQDWRTKARTWQPPSDIVEEHLAVNLAWTDTDEHEADPALILERAHAVRLLSQQHSQPDFPKDDMMDRLMHTTVIATREDVDREG